MEIQQWIGLIGVVAYWLFRAYTASKKASKNKVPPVVQVPKSMSEPKTGAPKTLISRSESRPSILPSSPQEKGVLGSEGEGQSNQKKSINYVSEAKSTLSKTKVPKQMPVAKEQNLRQKFKGFNGRDAVIYQAIMNRPEY